MTKNSELKSLARHFLETSKEVLKEDGYLSPLLIARAGKKAIVYSLPHDKEIWFPFVMTILRTLGAESYFVAGEAWAVANNQLVESLPPWENPGRTEEVFVYGRHRYGARIMLSQQFVRDPDRIRFIEPVDVCKSWLSLRMMPEKW
jgi:hypothetical protein